MSELVKTYLELVKGTPTKASQFVDKLSDDDRIVLRTALEAIKCRKLTRNLYYNYAGQYWIEGKGLINSKV